MKFSLQQALRNLDIEVKPFGYTGPDTPYLDAASRDGCRGYSINRWIAINPAERWPVFVTFHEMTHILLGHTTLHEKFGAEMTIQPNAKPSREVMAMMMYKDMHHDIFEAECHATAIIAAQLTGTPFDLQAEMDHLEVCYTRGREIPADVMARARKTAEKIAQAGSVGLSHARERILAA